MAYAGYSKLKALIVDDFDSFRMTVSKMLQDFGVRDIHSATSGSEALRLCRQNAYDLILCDHNLGKGKTGEQVLEDLRHHNILDTSTLFILISAESSRSVVMAAYDYEPDEYLAKPVTTRSLQRRLDRLMLRRQKMTPIHRAIKAGQIDTATALCRKEIAAEGRCATQCQKLLGELYLDQGDLDAAEAHYREVLEHRPLDWAMLGMARVKRARDDRLGAEQWLEQTLQEHPWYMQAYDLQAQLCREQSAPERLQKVLEEAVQVSPLSIRRQQQLGDTALENNDMATAAQAYRKAVRLGENSVYDKPEAHLNLARTTASLFQEAPDLAKKLTRDALKSLGDYESRFGKDPEHKAQSLLIEAQLFAGQGDKRKAEQLLQESQSLLEEGQVLSLDGSLELAKAFRALGQTEGATELLQELAEAHAGNDEQLQKLDRLLEEPVSLKNRKLVAEINQAGIRHHEASDYQKAIACFDQALGKFPRHIGVRLNLAQALLDKMRDQEHSEPDLVKLNETLSFVAETITPQHEQFRRYRQLQDLRQQCERKVKLT